MSRQAGPILALLLILPTGPARAGPPAWLDDGYPGARARQAVTILLSAPEEGLEKGDYDADGLARDLDSPSWSAAMAASFEAKLTAAMIRYISDLHSGRVDPRRIQAKFNSAPAAEFDPAAYLRQALDDDRLPEAVREAEPKLPLYAALRSFLARYHGLADAPEVMAAWQESLAPLPGGKLAPGGNYAGTALLARRLRYLGDLAGPHLAGKRYAGPLAEAVRAFQSRHGLEPDGVIGRQTLAQLDISPRERLRQIELAMERLRWTPLLTASRMIVVNIPEFTLRAYEVGGDGVELKLAMKVVVGKALKTPTPVFDMEMRYIEFSPYWNVPPSIAREELIPRLQRDPDYFYRQGFEFVDGGGQPLPVLARTYLQAVGQGMLRLRQRPGPDNPLGNIKFAFPNEDNIYLHHTPSASLFRHQRRDFSHGCIRVEDPVALALFVLAKQPEWTRERIVEAMERGVSATVMLIEPLPVVIAYSTALAKRDGRIYFFQDIYGQDHLLDQALRERTGVLRMLSRD